jgi:putative nucleotidyltransferase with HDIG domain
MQELEAFLDKIRHLPPAPRVLPQLLRELNNTDASADRIVDLVAVDPALTAGVLQACNSAYSASSTPVIDLQQAVTRLGFREVFRIVAAVSGSRLLGPRQRGYGLDEGELWKHSITTAVAAQLIARERGGEESLAYTAGLLHDLGKIVLADALEGVYTELNDEVEARQHSLVEAEKKLLGVQHAEVGGRLLERWNFPANIVGAVWHHHHPANAGAEAVLAANVYLGNMIAYFIGNGFGHQAFALRGRGEALELLGLKGDDLPHFMIRTYEHFEAIEAMLHMRG